MRKDRTYLRGKKAIYMIWHDLLSKGKNFAYLSIHYSNLMKIQMPISQVLVTSHTHICGKTVLMKEIVCGLFSRRSKGKSLTHTAMIIGAFICSSFFALISHAVNAQQRNPEAFISSGAHNGRSLGIFLLEKRGIN